MSQTVRTVLVFRCGTIGDTIVSVPAIAALREHFKGAAFVLMTASREGAGIWADHVLRQFGWFQGFITYDPDEVSQPAALLALRRRIAECRADVAVHLGTDRNSSLRVFRDRLFFRSAGIKRFLWCPSSSVAPTGRMKRADAVYPTEGDRLMAALGRYGIGSPGTRSSLPISAVHVERVSALLRDAFDEPPSLVAMCPGAKQPANRWPVERYREVGARLIENAGVAVAVVGGREEAEIGRQLAAAWPKGKSVIAAGITSVLESAELLRRSLFYVGNDTGPLHLAASVGTRCVAILGGRNPERIWHPAGTNHIVLRHRVPCRNCYLSDCPFATPRCLDGIDVNDVWAACQRMLVYS